MEQAFSLIEDLLVGPAQHDSARFALGHARKPDHLVLANHNLLDELTGSSLARLAPSRRRRDLGARDERGRSTPAKSACSMHMTPALVKLFGVIVDELAVDEASGPVAQNVVDLALHFLLFLLLDLSDGGHGLDAHAGTKILILSVSICVATTILAFSMRFLIPMLFSDEPLGEKRFPEELLFLMMWMCSRSVLPLRRRTASTAMFAKCSL